MMRQPLFFSAASLLEIYRFFALMFSALVATVFPTVFLSSNRKTIPQLRRHFFLCLFYPNLKNIGAVPYSYMPKVYQDADILLFPTVREGFGLAAAEAMACGLPVVATNCSSLPELISEGKGGYLCELGNADKFAAKINELAASPALRREMGEFNRTRVEEKFTISRMVKEYQQLFEEAIS